MSTPDLRSAASLLEKGDYDGARITLERLVDHDQAYVAAHVLLAKIAESQARFKDAILHWEHAYSINPMSTEVSVSYESAVLRTLLPNPASAPIREMNLVPPLEEINESEHDPDVMKSEGSAPDSSVPKEIESEKIVLGDSTPNPSDSAVTKSVVRPEKQLWVERIEDLDRLIDELDSAHIIPDPDIENISDAELRNDIDDVVSETLARIYASQNYFSEAGDVYEKLAVQHPTRKDEFAEKAADMFTRAIARN